MAGNAHESVSPLAQKLVESSGIMITNSMVVSWVVTIVLIVLARIAMSNMKLIPNRAQNLFEFIYESIYGLLTSILGDRMTKKTFWFFSTVFIFIVISNWSGLLPLTGNIITKVDNENVPIWRPGTADLNFTLALAVTYLFLWFYWSIQENGPIGFLKHIFLPKEKTVGFMGLLIGGVVFFVGIIEVISILFRPVSLSFRLYGNIFGGENVMHEMALPFVGIPFYFLEIMVGFIQGMVFTLLSAIFLALMCEHSHEDNHHEEKHN